MTGSTARLSQIRGLMVALFAVLFLAGPMADSLLCAADDIPAASAQVQTQAKAAVAVAQIHGVSHEAPGLCQHGHTHAAPAFAQSTVACVTPQAVAGLTPRPSPTRLPPSIAGPSLDRPPRA